VTVIKSKKLRESANGEDCTYNIAGVCNYNSETVVLSHQPSDIAGYKPTDLSSAYGCSSCHDVIDRRVINEDFEESRDFYLRRANVRTLTRFYEKGLIAIKGAA